MPAKTFLGIIATILIAFANAEYDVKKYCTLVQPGTKLPSLSSCKTFYICPQIGEPTQVNCTGSTVFSKNAQSCIPETNSNCYYDVSNPCQNKHNQFTGSSKGCNWYNWCQNGEIAGSATCGFGQIFNPMNQTCIPGKCGSHSENVTTEEVNSLCEIMPDGVYFGDFKDCKSWFTCSGMKMKSGSCSNALVFDANSGMCLKNEGNMCQRTNNVVTTRASGPPKYACDNVEQIVSDLNICSIYYTCKQSPPGTYQWEEKKCNNEYFDVISKSCKSTLLARPDPHCDRCQFKSGNPYWANAVDKTCSKYITCNNGQQVGTNAGSCGLGNVFSEEAQVCFNSNYMLTKYATHNGACQNYKCTVARVCSLVDENENNGSSSGTTTDTSTTDTTTTTTTTTKKPEEN